MDDRPEFGTPPEVEAPLTDGDREALRARGYRPVEVWVLDRSDPAYVAEAQRQAKIASAPIIDEYGDLDAFSEEMTRQAWADLPDYDWGDYDPTVDMPLGRTETERDAKE